MTGNKKSDNVMIDFRDLAVGYGSRKVLSGINAQVLRGQFVTLLGPNGVGKTTLLRTLSRLLKSLHGNVYIDSRITGDYSYSEFACKLAVVLTGSYEPDLLTGFEFASLGRYPHTGITGRLGNHDIDRIWESLRMVNAENLADRKISQLSDGEKQKLFIARALCQEPEIIVLDEPTSHLDLKHKIEIMSLLRTFCREHGITVVTSLHDLDIAARVSDRIGLIKNGGLMAWGSPEEVLHDESVRELYDLELVKFNRQLCTIEVQANASGADVFCLAGAGTGSSLFRLLIRNDMGVSTGVLHENDIDSHVAHSLGCSVVSVPPFAPVSDDDAASCFEAVDRAGLVIDTSFPVKDQNRANLKILEYAFRQNICIMTLRSRDEFVSLGLSPSENVIFFDDEHQLFEAAARRMKKI